MTDKCLHWWCEADLITAYSTVALTIFTALLFVFTYKLWEATKGTLKLARDEFIASHRPKLLVRNVVLKRPPISGDPWLTRSVVPSGQFYVENIGDTKAVITESHVIWFTTEDRLPMERPYEGLPGNNKVAPITLDAGMSVPGFFDATQWDFPLVQSLNSYAHYVMGWIEYRDAAGSRYRMAFCRHWDNATQRFILTEDSDYEHG